MDIHLHNTKTRKKELLVPVTPGRVGMYVCGPTVYDRAHIGNARPVIVFDVLFRLLRHVYGPENVRYVRNFTDVDDKIIARAEESGRDIGEITAETSQWYLDDMEAVGALEPTDMPRATEWIGAMVAMIEDLISGGHAYEAEGHVLFRVRSYEAYGALSGRSVDDMIAGARVEVAPYKEDPMDFVLWKPAKAGEPGWESPWGKGRPGWHIECSAMADALLGESFDIHGGGNDLMFPHHENEIAQSKCAHPEGEFARIWMHNEMLQVEGKKMSKSLGNFFTVRDLLDQGVPGEVIRFVFLGTHYRSPMDWTEEKRIAAMNTLADWFAVTDGIDENAYGLNSVVPFLAQDLNTPEALSHMHALYRSGKPGELAAAMSMLGLRATGDWWRSSDSELSRGQWMIGISYHGSLDKADQDKLLDLAHRWAVLRDAKDYKAADALRTSAETFGVQLRQTKTRAAHADAGFSFDPKELEGLA